MESVYTVKGIVGSNPTLSAISAVEADKSNEKIEAQIARRKKYYEKLWELDPKKKGPQYVGIRNFTYPEDDKPPTPKKQTPAVDVTSITKRRLEYEHNNNFEKPEKGIGELLNTKESNND